MTKFPLTSPPGQYLPKHIHEQNKQRRFYPQQNQMAPSSWNSHPGQGNILKGFVMWVVRRESIEPIKRVFTYVLFSLRNKMVRNNILYNFL